MERFFCLPFFLFLSFYFLLVLYFPPSSQFHYKKQLDKPENQHLNNVAITDIRSAILCHVFKAFIETQLSTQHGRFLFQP